MRLALTVVIFLWYVVAASGQESLTFRELPKEVRDLALDVRKACKDNMPEMTFTDMQGIQILDLNADGSRDGIVQLEDVRRFGRIAEANTPIVRRTSKNMKRQGPLEREASRLCYIYTYSAGCAASSDNQSR